MTFVSYFITKKIQKIINKKVPESGTKKKGEKKDEESHKRRITKMRI